MALRKKLKNFKFFGIIFLMGLSLKEKQIISEINELLCSFLPGEPHPFADEKISFKGVASDLGLDNFDGRDLYDVLDGKIRLDELIKLKARHAAETGIIMARKMI